MEESNKNNQENNGLNVVVVSTRGWPKPKKKLSTNWKYTRTEKGSWMGTITHENGSKVSYILHPNWEGPIVAMLEVGELVNNLLQWKENQG